VKKITLMFAVLSVIAASAALAAPPAPAADKKPTVEKPKIAPADVNNTLYAFGVFIAQRTPLGQADLTPEELETVLKGFSAAALKQPLDYKVEEVMPKVDQLLKERQTARGEIEKKKGAEFLEKAAAEPGAQKAPSGLIYTETLAGTGPQPTATDTVRVNYRGTLTNGTEFDSSYKRNEPTQFPLNGVIKCWGEGVAKMKVGGKAKLVCPSEIAYGERGAGGTIPPNAVLVFEVELVGIPSQDAGK
jgi:FKBP-type peptidyl-prolyl cis-trans isomerase FkpA